jgi:hypothetical protein
MAACSENKLEVGNGNDAGADGPIQCEYQGRMVGAGESVPAGDGCNTCMCNPSSREVQCTLRLCLPDSGTTNPGADGPSQCEYQGTMVSANETVPAGDGCNTCTCDPSYGHVICTRSVCNQDGGTKDVQMENFCLYQGKFYVNGATRPDACNCTCDGSSGQFVCTQLACANDGGAGTGGGDGTGGTGGSGGDTTACPFVASPKPISLGTVLGAGKSPTTGTIYMVDEVDNLRRLFISDSSGTLVRQRESGSGSGPDSLVFSTGGPDAIVTIQIDTPTGQAKRMGVFQGTLKDQKTFVIGKDGEELTIVADSDIAKMPLRNLPGTINTEYVASTNDGNVLLVTCPIDDYSYSNFRAFYGPATAMVERSVSSVTRYKDGGSTWIVFDLDGSTATASFPVVFADASFAPGPATLTNGAQSTSLTRLSSPPANASYICFAH